MAESKEDTEDRDFSLKDISNPMYENYFFSWRIMTNGKLWSTVMEFYCCNTSNMQLKSGIEEITRSMFLYLYLFLGNSSHASRPLSQSWNTGIWLLSGWPSLPGTWAMVQAARDPWIRAIHQACCTTLSNCFIWQQWELRSHKGNWNARIGDSKLRTISETYWQSEEPEFYQILKPGMGFCLETWPHLSEKYW